MQHNSYSTVTIYLQYDITCNKKHYTRKKRNCKNKAQYLHIYLYNNECLQWCGLGIGLRAAIMA